MSDLFPDSQKHSKTSRNSEVFYDEEGRIVGSPPAAVVSIMFFALATLIVLVDMSLKFMPLSVKDLNADPLWMHTEWHVMSKLPTILASSLYLYAGPLIFSIISFFDKKYTKRLTGLIVFSLSLTLLIVWILMILTANNFLM